MSAEQTFLEQFGETLYSPSTKETMTPTEALAGKTVMLYFSASWCGPCRRFTPMLIALYNKLKQDPAKASSFEVVFVSLDRSESDFHDYVSKMPWKCVPFSTSNSDLRTKLAVKYGAQGIPHLVVVESETQERKVITSDGTSEVQTDPNGDNFPWKPKSFSKIWPSQFLTKNGLIDSSALNDKHLMLYFSAHWCPPCRAFTPKLCQAYKTLKQEQGDGFELVFVSSDRDVESFDEYYGQMPFCALPFEEREAKQQLSKRFGIQGIPTLLILGPVDEKDGERPLINDNLRGVIESGDFSDFPFYPKPYQDLSLGADGINEHRSLIVFCENEDDDEQNDILSAVKSVAEKMKADSSSLAEETKFFYAAQPSGLVSAVRKLLQLENKLDGAIMALLDIPDNGGFYVSNETDITKENIEKFLAYPGERKQMSKS